MAEAIQRLRTGLVYDPVYKQHQPGRSHPEKPERCDVIMKAIGDRVPKDRLLRLTPRKALLDELKYCHTADYIRTACHEIQSGYDCLTSGDTDVSPGSLDAALAAAGGAMVAVDAVMAGTCRNAFCSVRPPGHHATPDRGMGFCIFNNVAIAARHAQKQHGIERVLIVDWDVHHGNGTQEIFYDDPTVFYFSTHQWPLYPGTGSAHETGKGPGKGFTLNCPMAAGCGGLEILGAFRERLVPAMRDFMPQFVFISAGFDSREKDPLGAFFLTDDDFSELTALMMDLAAQHACGRLVSMLEGGYNLTGLGEAAAAHVAQLQA